MAFMFPQPQQAMTPEGISRQRQIAQALMQQGMDYSPVQHWSQGAARIAQALLGGYKNQQADIADAALKRKEDLDAATEKAKAEAEKRNTPIFHEVDGSIYNWNPYMAEGGKPMLLSQAAQKADEWKSAGDGTFYRTGADGMPEFSQNPNVSQKADDWKPLTKGNQMYRTGADGMPEFAPIPGMDGESVAGNPYADEYQKQYAKDSAKKNAETARKITDSGLDAQKQLDNLDRMQQLTQDPDVYQGTGSQFSLPIRRAISNVPYLNDIVPYSSPEAVGKSDELASLSNTMALMVRNPDAGLGMPGALSDKDREFLQSTVPGLSRSPGGNQLMIEAAKRIQQRKIEIADFKAQYVQQYGQVDDKFFEIVSKWAAENPLFGDLQGQVPQAGGNTVAPSAPGGNLGRAIQHGAMRLPPRPGEVKDGWRFKGGDPADPNSWEPVQ